MHMNAIWIFPSRIQTVELSAWISLLACRHLGNPIPYFAQYGGVWNFHWKTAMYFNKTVTCQQDAAGDLNMFQWYQSTCYLYRDVFCVKSLYMLSFLGTFLHILNHTHDWWMGVLKPWVMVGSASAERSYASLKCKVPLCCEVKWHYPKDMWCDFVKVWTMNCVGGGMYKS